MNTGDELRLHAEEYATKPLFHVKPWSPASFRRRLVLGRLLCGCLRCVGCRARQRSGVEISDLVDALGELPAVRGALVAVVVHGVVQLRPALAHVPEL